MNRAELEQRVADYRDQELYKAHVRINSTPWWRQTERAATELRAVEARTETYRRSLGEPDSADDEQPQQQPEEQPDEPTPKEPAPATAEEPAPVVQPGVK